MLVYTVLVLTMCGIGFCQTVHTDVGTFIGFLDDVTFNGTERQVVKYIGIPYGEPTGGANRFAKPKPKPPLKEPYIANRTDLPNICPQLVGGYIQAGFLDGRLSEDCLYLSIYAPASSLHQDTRKHAVMIWVHGGSYSIGLSDQYPGDILSAFNDVVVVVINYRLNVFGFFSTGDEHAPGNLGLWDQQLAIQWVHDHIVHFGGDPDEVTLFGGSAGSKSVLYQAMFPGNDGLFKHVIAQSGIPSPTVPSNMLPFARFAGCNQSSTAMVVSCLRSMSWKELSDKAEDPQAPAIFKPVVDGEFIKRPPAETMSDMNSEEMKSFSSINIVFGVNDYEAVMFMIPYFGRIAGVKEEDISWIALKVTYDMEIQKNAFEDIILPKMITKYVLHVPEADDTLKFAIASKYSDWKDPYNPSNIRDKVMDLITDLLFHVPSVKAADAHSAAVSYYKTGTNTFFYEYAYFSDMFITRPDWMKVGADHTDELLSVFGFTKGLYPKYHVAAYDPDLSDVKMASIVMKLWTTFAKSGNPNPNSYSLWPTYTKESRKYIKFLNESLTFISSKQNFGEPRVSFWLDTIPAVIKGATSVNECLEDSDDTAPNETITKVLVVVSCILVMIIVILIIILVMILKRKSKSSTQYRTSSTKVELV